MVGYGGTLGVLVWKHYTVRRRRFVHSTFEFVSPAILFALFFTLWMTTLVSDNRHEQNEQSIPEAVEISGNKYINKLFFTPYSAKALDLIKLAAEKLYIKKTGKDVTNTSIDPYTETEGYWSCGNVSEMLKFIDIMQPSMRIRHQDVPAGIIFQSTIPVALLTPIERDYSVMGLNSSDWPRKLNYTVRMRGSFFTRDYKSLTPGYHEQFGEEYEAFVAVQWAIDTAYIELLTGKPVLQKLSVQHFPKPRSVAEDPGAQLVYSSLLACTLLSPLVFFLFFVSRLAQERCSGVKELMKMVGVSSLTLQLSHLVNSLPACVAFVALGTLLAKVTSRPLLPETSGALVAAVLLLYFVYVIALAFLCSTFLKSINHAVSLALTVYVLSLALGGYVATHVPSSSRFFLLTGLLPHVPVYWFWGEVGVLMKYRDGSTFVNMFRAHHAYSGSVAWALLFQLLQCALLGQLAWYADQVRPGKYGIAKPWNFAFQYPMRKSKEKVTPNKEPESDEVTREGEYYEMPPTNGEIGIKIENVTKVFGGRMEPKNVALKNVSLDIYKGEITVLLGHNGAGKTTLMSIITGMFSATEGKVYIKGMEISKHLTEIRKSIGLCPQHNLTFDDLTVMEHIVFFSMLKGATYGKAVANCNELLAQLKIQDKADNMSGQLSGGMRRRLQLGCALAGGAEVLILDEPTSGLDVETRRELWNLLLSLRGDRTVLLTTHFMEEADALGDRVAALHGGELRCHATPMHLKRAIGTGYRLSLTLEPNYSQQALETAVRGVVPEARVHEAVPSGLTFSLPSKDSNLFPELFNKLEERRRELRIMSMGVGVTTLEEVFLRLCSDKLVRVAPTITGADANGEPEHPLSGVKDRRLRGVELTIQQFKALLMRHVKYVLSKKNAFLWLEVVIPVVTTLYMAYALNATDSVSLSAEERNPPRDMNLGLYGEHGGSKVFYNGGGYGGELLDPFRDGYSQLQFVSTDDVVKEILREGASSMSEYNQLLVAVELNETFANALYTTTVRHAMPVSVNLLSNMLAKLKLGWAKDPDTITTVNHPVERKRSDLEIAMDDFVYPKATITCVVWALIMAALVTSFLVPMITIAVLERLSGTRHIRIMSGVPCAVYLAAMWLFHLAVFAATALPTVLVATGLLDFDSTFNNLHFMAALCTLLMIHALAFALFMYLLSYFTSETGATSILNIIILVFCVVMPTFRYATASIDSIFWNGLAAVSMVFPPYNLAYGLLKMASAAQLNAWCRLNRALCPNRILAILGMVPEFPIDCCKSDAQFGPVSYFDFTSTGAGTEIVALIVQIFVYGALVLLMEMGTLNRLWDACWNKGYAPPQPYYRDERVAAEKQYVDNLASCTEPRQCTMGEDTALVHGLHKNYRSALGKPCNSVKGVSFSVKHGECFGLLGVNGAGKTTVFKMLTGAEHATRGDIFANGYHARTNRNAYLSTLAYCPQFGGLDHFLSGWDNVELMARLRGVPGSDVGEEVASWIEYVDLADLKSKPVGAYSGGCARRAATAAALAGVAGAGRRMALLDEPTAGVDPVARRRVWAALRRSLAQGLSVVITSHSMDETEALCSRIGIMSRGELGALGSAAALRASHATGFSAQLKLRTSAPHNTTGFPDDHLQAMSMDETDYVDKDAANKLKEHLRTNFNGTLKDEHKTMLHYHIAEGIRYSELFTRMEELKRQFPELLEDYTISETTLEEVFLAFAKDARADDIPPGHA